MDHRVRCVTVVCKVGTAVETTWARVDGLHVRCLAVGRGGAPPVLLLHGGGFDAADFSYRYAIEPLSRLRPVLAFDWPGYGGSDTPKLRYDLAYYSRFLERLMDSLGIQRAAFVGISMGGGAALSFALCSPERVESDELIQEARRLWNQPASGRAFRSFRKSEVGWSGLKTDLSDRLGELAAPTLLVHGDRDRVVPVEWARRAHERLPDSELRVLLGCGHWPPRECPDTFNRVVTEFLAR